MGLIQPVLLREKRDGYQIVCGFRRVFLFRELGNVEIDSHIFGDGEWEDRQFFFLSLHENLTTRGFNTVEKAIALEKLVHRFEVGRAEVVKAFLPFFSLEPNEKILNTYLSLAQMEDEVKRYVLKEEVSRSNIRKLSTLSHDDRTTLLSLLSSLRLGENRLREVLNLLDEISRREGLRMKEVVQQKEFQNIFSRKNLTPSQRAERVKKVLMDLRYPRMRERERTFEKKRGELNLPPFLSLNHQPFFEGKGMKIEFQFETIEEYQKILSALSILSDKKEFQEMIGVSTKSQAPNNK
jgi:ParB family chromosome partitioning protein